MPSRGQAVRECEEGETRDSSAAALVDLPASEPRHRRSEKAGAGREVEGGSQPSLERRRDERGEEAATAKHGGIRGRKVREHGGPNEVLDRVVTEERGEEGGHGWEP